MKSRNFDVASTTSTKRSLLTTTLLTSSRTTKPGKTTSGISRRYLLGWSQLLQGRFSDAWRKHYQQYLGSKATNKKNSHTWVTTIITTIFNQWLDLWKLRNHDKHGKDYKAQADAAHRQAVIELINMYEMKDQVLPHHAWIFKDPIHELQNKSTSYIRAIVANFKPMIEQAIKAQALESYQTRLETG